MKISNTNMVNIEKAFLDQGNIYLIYEYISVSLAEIIASLCGDLKEYEIAAVCHQVCTPRTRKLIAANHA